MEAKRIRLVVAGRLYPYEIKKNFSGAAERRGGVISTSIVIRWHGFHLIAVRRKNKLRTYGNIPTKINRPPRHT